VAIGFVRSGGRTSAEENTAPEPKKDDGGYAFQD
jgi:hypothetical protein